MLLPLAGAVAGLTARWWKPRDDGRVVGLIASAATAGSFLLSAAAIWGGAERPLTGTAFTVADFGRVRLEVGYHIDALTLLMFAVVTLIAACITVFAQGYLSDELTGAYRDHHVSETHDADPHVRPGRFHLFFAYLCLFTTAMLGLVLAGNLFALFCGWELVGACSYLLIGFYRERPVAAAAATKAFVVNRVGDCGFLVALAALLSATGDLRFGPLFDAAAAGDIPPGSLTVAGLGLLAGCVGKSAQFPLQVWLPDAMAGPTPVSALVHSATMVAAGVYLGGRMTPLLTPAVLLTAAAVGCVTLFVGALAALAQTDLKRILAYSTISQLGYMMLALGVGGWGAGLFHLVTHAFFKSLMFLAAGSVIVACGHRQDLRRLGGLWRRMPVTAGAMLVGVIAISGLAVPGVSLFGARLAFSGHHSKDAILTHALAFARAGGPAVLYWVPLVTAGITALYMFRLWLLTFAGPPREPHADRGGNPVHESPWVMTGPLVLLSLLAMFCAVGGEDGPLFARLAAVAPAEVPLAGGVLVTDADVEAAHGSAATAALVAAAAGTLLALVLYGARLVVPKDGVATWPLRFARSGWGFDTLYRHALVRPAWACGTLLAAVDRRVLDGLVDGTAAAARGLGAVGRGFDDRVVDGLVRGTASAAGRVGGRLRSVQTGSLRQYVAFLAAAAVAVFLLAALFFPR